jgi:hypothetical protein
MLTHPYRGELPQRLHLRKSDRLKRMAETKPAAALHLTKDECESSVAGLRGDNVDLPQPAAPISAPTPACPAAPNSAQAKSSPRTPNCFFDSVAGIAHLRTKACAHRAETCRATEICGNALVSGCGKRPPRPARPAGCERRQIARRRSEERSAKHAYPQLQSPFRCWWSRARFGAGEVAKLGSGRSHARGERHMQVPVITPAETGRAAGAWQPKHSNAHVNLKV